MGSLLAISIKNRREPPAKDLFLKQIKARPLQLSYSWGSPVNKRHLVDLNLSKLIALLGASTLLAVSFQDCSKGFSAVDLSSISAVTGASTGDSTTGSSNNTPPPQNTGAGAYLSAQYPGDVGIQNDPSVINYTNFESGYNGWLDYGGAKGTYINIVNNPAVANGGSSYLQTTVTKSQLNSSLGPYISAYVYYPLPQPVPILYERMYVQVVGNTAHPHHWIRVTAGSPTYQSDGLADTVPAGDQGFWYNFDISSNDTFFDYVYWYQMRSGRCNNGTAVPGCAGDQGFTYYYGNVFNPANQTPFQRDKWVCLELETKANTLGQSDGLLKFWVNNQLVGDYEPGTPLGTWLRDQFFTFGQYDTNPQPFSGFNFRSASDVLLKRVLLGSYYQANDSYMASAPEDQTILYDDVVLATKRIGCKN